MRHTGNLKASRRTLIVLTIICAAVFAVSAGLLINYYWTGHEAEKAFDELRISGDAYDESVGSDNLGDSGLDAKRQAHYLELYEKNRDFVGWLRIFDTDVDYPVVQTPNDRDYYLHRGFDKKSSASGTLYASDISNIDKPSDVIILFGHMMNNGTMFGGLKNYSSRGFMDGHRTIRFDTLTEERDYKIFCVFVESVNTGRASEFKYYQASDFGGEDDFNEFIDQAQSRSLYDTGEAAVYGDEILVLSTCEYTQADGRLVLLAKRYNPGAATGGNFDGSNVG